jgi:hypothetical protein
MKSPKSLLEAVIISTILLFQFVQSKTFTVFNACPSVAMTLKFGSTPSVDQGTISLLYTGYSSPNTVSYSPVYYQILDENNNLLVTSTLTITNDNMNGIGYVLYPTGGCQHFQYAPTDSSLSSKSVMVYVNGAQMDKNASVGSAYQGRVYAKPNSYLQITSNSTIVYTDTNVNFCNVTCAYSFSGGATIPVGSAIFFINFYYTTTSPTSSVVAAITGSTTVVYWCPEDDCGASWDLWFDDDIDVTTNAGALAGINLRSFFGFCLFCVGGGYLIYRYSSKKKDIQLSH